jgi:hypothetical protein
LMSLLISKLTSTKLLIHKMLLMMNIMPF